MLKKLTIFVLIAYIFASINVFADEKSLSISPGIIPDSPLYVFDKMLEKIQLTIITDAVKEAQVLVRIAEERLAESNAMIEKEEIELSEKAIIEYTETLSKAVNTVEKALVDGKEITQVIAGITENNIRNEDTIGKILEQIPEEYREQIKETIEKVSSDLEAIDEVSDLIKDADSEDNAKEESVSYKQQITSKIITDKIQDTEVLSIIEQEQLNSRQVLALISLANQSGKTLNEVIAVFLNEEKGLGATAKALQITPKEALKGINSTFKETKAKIKNEFKDSIKSLHQEQQKKIMNNEKTETKEKNQNEQKQIKQQVSIKNNKNNNKSEIKNGKSEKNSNSKNSENEAEGK